MHTQSDNIEIISTSQDLFASIGWKNSLGWHEVSIQALRKKRFGHQFC